MNIHGYSCFPISSLSGGLRLWCNVSHCLCGRKIHQDPQRREKTTLALREIQGMWQRLEPPRIMSQGELEDRTSILGPSSHGIGELYDDSDRYRPACILDHTATRWHPMLGTCTRSIKLRFRSSSRLLACRHSCTRVTTA